MLLRVKTLSEISDEIHEQLGVQKKIKSSTWILL